jgi:hypothetical protein
VLPGGKEYQKGEYGNSESEVEVQEVIQGWNWQRFAISWIAVV